MFAIILFACAVIILYYFITSPFKYWKNRNVPHPPVSYLFGNVGHAIFSKVSVQEIYDELYKKYPSLSYIGFYKGRTPGILLRDPDIVKKVLVKNFTCFSDNEIHINEKQDPLFAKNPFVSKGDFWKKNRSQIASSFTAKRVKEMYPLMENVVKNLIKYINIQINDSNGTEMRNLFIKYTTDVTTTCALGIDANSFVNPNSEPLKMYNKIISPSFFVKINTFLIFNFPLLVKLFKLRFIPKEADDFYKAVASKAIEYRKVNKIYRGDFLDGMIQLKEKLDYKTFTDIDIVGHVMTFILEGTETSSIALSFTLYELALHLDMQETLRKEVDETIQRCQGKVTVEAIQEMKYLDQIVNESMRKNTIAPLIRRVCTKECSIESPDGKGPSITIEPGTTIIIPIFSLHNDPKFYPNPHVFDPSRFSKENERERPAYTYLPFGDGPRICLGSRFASAQAKVALVHLIANFKFTINKKTIVPYVIDPRYFLLEAKGGLWVNVHKRE